MIYDCFTFFNELDLLEIRLNVLNDVVDKFVLVEATKNHRGEAKPLFFQENKGRFKEFEDKIIHIIVSDYPEYKNTWTYENYQRNCISKGLIDCKDDDIILISDLDEIPNPKLVIKNMDFPGIKNFRMPIFHYYLNRYGVVEDWSHGTKMLFYKDFLNILDEVENYGEYCQEELNQGTTATKVHLYYGEKQTDIKRAGWHFTGLGGAEKLAYKFNSCSLHGPKYYFLTIEDAKKRILDNKFMDYSLITVKLDRSFPKYIVDNKHKYKDLILPNAKASLYWLITKKRVKREILKFIGLSSRCNK